VSEPKVIFVYGETFRSAAERAEDLGLDPRDRHVRLVTPSNRDTALVGFRPEDVDLDAGDSRSLMGMAGRLP
jgi:hypothetical protein